VDGSATTFGTTGYTFNNVFVLYDRATDTVWYPLDDGAFDAISGELKGSQLPFLDKPPIVSLGSWRLDHPDTLVLLGDAEALAAAEEGTVKRSPAVEGYLPRPRKKDEDKKTETEETTVDPAPSPDGPRETHESDEAGDAEQAP